MLQIPIQEVSIDPKNLPEIHSQEGLGALGVTQLPLVPQEMLEEGNVSIVEYGQQIPSDTTVTLTPETTETTETTQRVPWKVQATLRNVGK